MKFIEPISDLTNYIAGFLLIQAIVSSEIPIVLEISAVAQLKYQVKAILSGLNIQQFDNTVELDLSHYLNLPDQIVQQSFTESCPINHLDCNDLICGSIFPQIHSAILAFA